MALNYLIKPSLETKFFIDYDWWETSRDDLQIYLLTHLSEEQQQALANRDLQDVYDYVHPETGEVFALDALGMAIRESSQERRLHQRSYWADRQRVSCLSGQWQPAAERAGAGCGDRAQRGNDLEDHRRRSRLSRHPAA